MADQKAGASVAVFGSGHSTRVVAQGLARIGHEVRTPSSFGMGAKLAPLSSGAIGVGQSLALHLLKESVDWAQGELLVTESVDEALSGVRAIFLCFDLDSPNNWESSPLHPKSLLNRLIGRKPPVIVLVGSDPLWSRSFLSFVRDAGLTSTDLPIVSNPLLLPEDGDEMHFLRPGRLILGGNSQRASRLLLKDIYAPIVSQTFVGGNPDHKPTLVDTELEVAELTKFLCSSYLVNQRRLFHSLNVASTHFDVDPRSVLDVIGFDSLFSQPNIMLVKHSVLDRIADSEQRLFRTRSERGFNDAYLALLREYHDCLVDAGDAFTRRFETQWRSVQSTVVSDARRKTPPPQTQMRPEDDHETTPADHGSSDPQERFFSLLSGRFLDALRAYVRDDSSLLDELLDLDLEAEGQKLADALVAPLIWARAIGERLETTEVAQTLGVTRQALSKRLASGTLLGVPGKGTTYYPTWQFDFETRSIRPVVAEIIHTFREGSPGVDSLTVASWTATPQFEDLDGATPEEWVLKGGDKEQLLVAARRAASRLAQ